MGVAVKTKTGGEAFARGYVRQPIVKCRLCLAGPEAVQFVAEVVAAMESDPNIYVPKDALRAELEARFGYHANVGSLSRHVRECVKVNPWRRWHGGAR